MTGRVPLSNFTKILHDVLFSKQILYSLLSKIDISFVLAKSQEY